MDWTFQESNPGGGEIFRIHPDRPWGPPSLLYRSFPGVKRPGHGIDHPPPSSTEVEGRVELFLYPPFGPSWPVLGWTLLYLCDKLSITLTHLHVHLWANTVPGTSCLTCKILSLVLYKMYTKCFILHSVSSNTFLLGGGFSFVTDEQMGDMI